MNKRRNLTMFRFESWWKTTSHFLSFYNIYNFCYGCSNSVISVIMEHLLWNQPLTIISVYLRACLRSVFFFQKENTRPNSIKKAVFLIPWVPTCTSPPSWHDSTLSEVGMPGQNRGESSRIHVQNKDFPKTLNLIWQLIVSRGGN